LFGPEVNLVGTLTRPKASAAADLGVVLLNAGVIGRIGPHRINVKLARELALEGVASLRFDAAGLGDSAASSHGLPWEKQAIADLRAALDCLGEHTGARRFAVIGLCSGADTGYAAALEDERIVGLLMIDPFAYPTLRSHLIRYAKRIRQRGPVGAVRSWILRNWRELRRTEASASAGAGSSPPRFSRNAPPKEVFAAGLQRLVDRGARLHLIYAAGAQEYYNHPGQFLAAFSRWPFARHVKCEYVATFDHMITSTRAQRQLVGTVRGWVAADLLGRAHATAEAAQQVPVLTGARHERVV
jgi:alpha-beta hydrolase superfamily lysophospholipase